MKMIFATNNSHKLSEVQALLDGLYTLSTPVEHGITEDIPEEQQTLEGNSAQKARYIYTRTSVDCFADDTGLEVEALGGAPGVYSARYAGEQKDMSANIELLLRNLKGKSNRKARFRTVITLIIGGVEHQFEGVVNGVISEALTGEGGFGYDPVFIPDGFDVSFAEMSAQQKNEISHRARAIQELIRFLKNQS